MLCALCSGPTCRTMTPDTCSIIRPSPALVEQVQRKAFARWSAGRHRAGRCRHRPCPGPGRGSCGTAPSSSRRCSCCGAGPVPGSWRKPPRAHCCRLRIQNISNHVRGTKGSKLGLAGGRSRHRVLGIAGPVTCGPVSVCCGDVAALIHCRCILRHILYSCCTQMAPPDRWQPNSCPGESGS